MANMVFVNFPVSSVERSVAFYTKLGFQQNMEFSHDKSAAMVWNDRFWIMLLAHDFYSLFIGGKKIADTKITNAALVSFDMPSPDAIKQFGQIAKENGGSFYHVDLGIPEDQMYALEVEDLDGNMLEPMWMPET